MINNIYRYLKPLRDISLLVGLGLLLFSCAKKEAKNTKYIAYIGRYTDVNDTLPLAQQTVNKFDLLHEISLKKYIENIELSHTSLKIKTFDCRKSGRLSDSIYKVIAQDSNIVAVIDNTWGSHIRECAQTIKTQQIPVIAINADRNQLDFGNNAIFTGNNDHVPLDEIFFLKKALKQSKINFISEKDYPIHETFMEEFKKNGIELAHVIELNGKNFSPKDSLQLFANLSQMYALEANQKTVTIINTHAKIGNMLISYLDKNYSKLKLLGHNYIVDIDRLRNFGAHNKNSLILISHPTDAISKQLTVDIENFTAGHPQYFDYANNSMFVKRCLDAAMIIKNKFKYAKDTNTCTKKDFINYFHSLRGQSVKEQEDLYEFDSLLTMLPELYFVEYGGGKLSSYPLQLSMEREVIPNLFFGMEIVDIYNIDINSNSFTSDFYYWVKLDTSQREAEKFIIFQNMKQNESSKELIIEKRKGSMMYKLYKVSGVFYVNFKLKEYPFDQQEIFIQAEILNPSNQIKVSFDEKTFTIDPATIAKLKINEWQKEKFYVTVENTVSTGLHGDPDISEARMSKFKNIYYRLIVNRNAISPLLEIVLPLYLIGIVAISLLMIKDVSFENLGEVSIGVFITIVAFSISYATATPNTEDLTRADMLFWTTFAVVLIVFLIVIVTNSIYDKDRIVNIDLRRWGVAMGVVFTVLSALYIFW